MSQITYTELEGQPLRWPYRQAVPIEAEQVSDNSPKTWSVSTTPATLIQNANTGTSNDVYGANMLAQVFITPNSAVKITSIQLYGLKSGSPPNPTVVEIRDIKESNESVIDNVYPASANIFSYLRTSHYTINNAILAQRINYPKNYVPTSITVYCNGAATYTFTIRKGSITGEIVYGPHEFTSGGYGFVTINIPAQNAPFLSANTDYFYRFDNNAGRGLGNHESNVSPYGEAWIGTSPDPNKDFEHKIDGIISAPFQLYGSRRIAMPFTTVYDVGKIEFVIKKIGNPSDLVIELRYGDKDGPIISQTTISANDISTVLSWVSASFSYDTIYHGEKTFYFIFKTSGGDSENYYEIHYAEASGTIYIDTGEGWQSQNNSSLLKIHVKKIYPGENVLTRGEISPATWGTSAAWRSASMTSIALRPNTVYSLVVYTIGGDASNKYVIHCGASSLAGLLEYFLTSSNSGGSWTIDTTKDLSFKLDGVAYAKIYDGFREIIQVNAPAIPILQTYVVAQTSSSMEFAGFDDYTLTSQITTSTSTSQTKITTLSATWSRLRNSLTMKKIRWEIWGAGAGLSTKALTQIHAYYNVNPVRPRDFGFTELYILRITAAEDGTLVMINEHQAAMIYLPNNGDSYIAPGNFNFPAYIITVLSGKPIIDMIGIL